MTVDSFAKLAGFKTLCLPCPEKEIGGVYVCDLLSWVIGRAAPNDLWITIMSNVNVIAVASLADISAVILAEGVTLDDGVMEVAVSKGINVLSADISAYNAAVLTSDILK